MWFVWDLTPAEASSAHCGLLSLFYFLSDAGPENAMHIHVKALSLAVPLAIVRTLPSHTFLTD